MTHEKLSEDRPILVTINNNDYCHCCKRTHMRKVFHISSTLMDDFDLGYVCAGYWFKINLSGNITKARTKLQSKLNAMPREEVLSIVDRIFEEHYKAMAEE